MSNVGTILRGLVFTIAASLPLAAVPADPAAPQWNRLVRLDDGREFVTDRNIMLEVRIVKPATLPTDTVPGGWLQGFLRTVPPGEYSLEQLERRTQGGVVVYVMPGDTMLDARYVEYLKSLDDASDLHLRSSGRMDPVQIVLDGEPIGVVMPMAH
jgi:hypothetical protein